MDNMYYGLYIGAVAGFGIGIVMSELVRRSPHKAEEHNELTEQELEELRIWLRDKSVFGRKQAT